MLNQKMSKSEQALADNVIDTDYIFFKLHENEFVPTFWQRFKRLFWKKTDSSHINTSAGEVVANDFERMVSQANQSGLADAGNTD